MTLRFFTATTILTAVLAMWLTACTKAPPPPEAGDPVVTGSTIRFPPGSQALRRLLTAPVMPAQERVVKLPGRIVWDEDHTSRIAPPVAGRLEKVLVQAGARVNAGQPLAYLTSPDLGSAQTDGVRAQAEVAQARRNLDRIQSLFAVSGIAAKDLEQAQLDFSRARAEAERASLRLKSLGAENIVDQHYTLRSPNAGVVVERNTNPGMEWRPDQPGAPLFVVSDPTYLWCWIDAPEHALNTLHPGVDLTLRSAAWPEETFNARIDYVGDALDPSSRTVKMRARLRNPDRHLKVEMYVTAEFTSQAHGMFDVPAKAVFLNNGEQQVFVKTADGEYARKTIIPVASDDKWVSIAQGLKAGDEVVVDGALYLQKLLDDSSQPASSAVSQAEPLAAK